MCDQSTFSMRRDYLFHELYSENHGSTKPCWITYVALDCKSIQLQFELCLSATTSRI